MKYSKQRDTILKEVQNSINHPSAYMVYENVKKDLPNISLGTVYRNLNLLSDLGQLRKIEVLNGNDRYDKTLISHSHFICNKCLEVFDIMDEFNDINNNIESKLGCKILSHDLVFMGVCNNCLGKEG